MHVWDILSKCIMWSHTDIKILHMNHNNGDNQNKQSFMLQCMMGGFIV